MCCLTSTRTALGLSRDRADILGRGTYHAAHSGSKESMITEHVDFPFIILFYFISFWLKKTWNRGSGLIKGIICLISKERIVTRQR